MYVTTEPAHEIESGLVDLELARALPRHRLLTRSLLLAVATIAGGLVLMFAGTSAGGRLFGAPPAEMPSAMVRASLLIHLGAVALCFAGFGLFRAARTVENKSPLSNARITSASLIGRPVTGLPAGFARSV